MKTSILIGIFSLGLVCLSCKNKSTEKESESSTEITSTETNTTVDKVFDTDWNSLTKNYMTWYNYSYYNIRLGQEFIAQDVNDTPLDKLSFLNKLINENVVAFKTKITKGLPVYRLFKLNSTVPDIKTTSKQMAATELEHVKKEGTFLPAFNFIDINGNQYTAANTKGKTLILKCWFIHCVACVAEFPELNQLVAEYKKKNDILFISLASDEKDALLKFLSKRNFDYATIPKMGDYMKEQLGVSQFPTHIVVGADGKIKKVTTNVVDLKPFLTNYLK